MNSVKLIITLTLDTIGARFSAKNYRNNRFF